MGAIIEATEATAPYLLELRRESFWIHHKGVPGDGSSADRSARSITVPAAEAASLIAALTDARARGLAAARQETPEPSPSDEPWTAGHAEGGLLVIGGPFALVSAEPWEASGDEPASLIVHAELLYVDAAALIKAIEAA